MRLRKWVKISLVIITAIALVILFTKWTNKEIDKCVSGGHTEQYCRAAIK